jgi:hypothetical protein
MKKKLAAQSAFFNSRVLIGFAFCLVGVLLALLGLGLYPGASARAQGPQQSQKDVARPEVVPMVGPVSQDQDLRALPYIPSRPQFEEQRLMRHPPSQIQSHGTTDPARAVRQSAQAAAMPTPIATFAGMNSTQSGCGCLPPDTHGDVGPNHYIQSVNSSIKIFDKTGTALNGVNGTTYNSFFSPLASSGTPCGLNENDGDGFVFYDQLADRWVVSDFAFAALPGPPPFYQCIGVSKTSDPVAGGWWLYALQVDPLNPHWVGDYPKFGLWPDAYYLSVNMFNGGTLGFEGVRVYALPRSAMINGTGAPNPGAVAFTVLPAGLDDSYSLVPATFRAGSAPPVNTPEYFMAVDSPLTADVVLTQVKTWKFHVDFGTPGNSTFGVGANRTPDGIVTVNGFVDAFTSTTLLVPQNGTTAKLDTLGDKLMTPLVYQNLSGTESLWASQTVNNNQNGTGPTAIRWYQFDVTGGTIPATPVQQQTFNNGGDGLWRFMPSITVDAQGNMAIGYSVSSSTSEPSIRYAGRLAGDSVNSLAQGEAVLIAGGGHQTHSSGRWGDYSGMSIDPTDNLTFWHTNEYYSVTSSAGWNTRIGKFKFPSPLSLVSALSRKIHSGAGPFDIDLPLTTPRGIECRSGGPTNDYTIVFTFTNLLTAVDSVSPGCGSVSSSMIDSSDAHRFIVNLTGVVCNEQYITITLTGVHDNQVQTLASASTTIGLLLGDTTGNGSVNSSDISQTKAQSGTTTNLGNFRTDVTVNGLINSSDISTVKSKSGTALP